MEMSGRVGDTPTVAGNYASSLAGISCTGIGEEIVNNATAARVVVRVEDGMSLATAVNKTIKEANQHQYHFGLIGLDHAGNWQAAKTEKTDYVFFAVHDGTKITTFSTKERSIS